uniref:Uncharacterized protein AlNc14C19G2020 n=1 Tax=Albugo laibachii Nc14 TaxID=890382 RepID=F0W549_9STRA|nr:conserved hypothetical protein [Albugo laibachii Nc14]|eukprot:CCA16240.1 conserved hypothetical protein [Albugo laibachii Nc14]
MRQYSSVEFRTLSDAWTAEEHERFLIGLERCGMYGKTQIMSQGMWQIILEAVGATKSLQQVQDHAQRYFMQLQAINTHKPIGIFEQRCLDSTWTMEEEKRFEVILSKWQNSQEYSWQEVSNTMPGRSLDEVKERYSSLCEDVRRIQRGHHVTVYYTRCSRRPYNAVSMPKDDKNMAARMQHSYLAGRLRLHACNHNNALKEGERLPQIHRRESNRDLIILSKQDQRHLLDAIGIVQASACVNSPAVSIVITAVTLLLGQNVEIRDGLEARFTLNQAQSAMEKIVYQLELQRNNEAPTYHFIVNELILMLGLAYGPIQLSEIQSQTGLVAPLSMGSHIQSGSNYPVHPMPMLNTLKQCKHLHQYRPLDPAFNPSLLGHRSEMEGTLLANSCSCSTYQDFNDGSTISAALYRPQEPE